MIHSSTLQKYALFGGLMEEQIKEILLIMEEEKFNPEELIITEGKTNDRLFFIIEGQVSVSKKDVVLTKFSEGDVFGEMEVLDVMPAVATIKAITPVITMTISNKSLRDIYKKDIITFTLMLMNLARDLVRRLRKMDEKIITPKPVFY
jgi:CRP-like cAMP-binding protein